MSLRGRLALLTSAAVALAIVVSSGAAWLLIRDAMLDEVDQQLLDRRSDVEAIARLTEDLTDGEAPPGRFLAFLQGDAMSIQLLDADGNVARQITPDGGDLGVDGATEERLESTKDGELQTLSIDGDPYRTMAVTLADGERVMRLFQPLESVQATLSRIAWLLAAVAAAGVVAAGLLGRATARTGLRPVDQLVSATEQVAATKDLGHRVDLGSDPGEEISRLSASINTMLGALEEARTQQRELVENAGHELRTPLATLRNDLGLLLHSEQASGRRLSSDERADLLSDLETEAEALSDLVAEVIDLARGEIEPEPLMETDIDALLERAAARNRRVNPDVSVEVDSPGVHAMVHPAALERAASNLVRNAVQASPDGGRVEVAVFEDGDEILIRVADRGPGISDEDLPRIFDRFYRGAEARERHGSGLGLAIVAQVAELHDGSVAAENRPDGGAVFTLRVRQIPPDS